VTTLSGLVEQLEMLQVLVAPAGLNVEVRGIVVYDSADEPAIEPGDLVLGVGVRTGRSADADLLLRAAEEAGASAVVLKVRGPGPAVALTRFAGTTAVLGVAADVAWGQLYTLLRTAAAAASTGDGGDGTATGPGGVPVGDLFTLANAVAAMVGGPTTIESPQSVVLAYSSLDEPIDGPRRDTILGRRVPESWLRRLNQDGVFQRLWRGDEVVRVNFTDPNEIRPRLAVAVRAGGQILGSIWVAEGRKPLGPEAEVALREAARIAALHLVRHQVGDDLERRRRSDAFRSVLEGRRPAELLPEPLGIPLESATTVIAFEIQAEEGVADLALHLERVGSLIALYAEAYRHQVVCTGIGRTIYALVTSAARSGTTARDRASLRRLATAIADQSHDSLGVTVRAGIGSTLPDLAQLTKGRAEADLILRAMAGSELAVADVGDVYARVVLLQLRDLADREPRLLAGKLGVLTELDAKRHTAYVPTLRAYLDALGDVPAAAASMNVHPNTYRYRLRRLVELAGLDLDDPVERLVVHLQLHLRADVELAGAEDGQRGQPEAGQLSLADEED
jgi:hypothetical protein